MARDSKLRDVLDSLSGDPAKSLPTPDRELMESVLRRLKIQENRRLALHEEEPEPDEEDLTEQELEALRARQQQDAEEMQRLQEERERLMETQRELEDRLARLEAASHGGPLSYVDEPETVEFSRVDLDSGDEELLEFQYLGEGGQDIGGSDGDAWEEPATPTTDWGDWPETSDQRSGVQRSGVQWDEEEQEEEAADWSSPAAEPATEPAWEEEPAPSEWPEEPEPSPLQEETPPWSQPQQDEPWPEEGETDGPAATETPDSPATAEEPAQEVMEDLDDRTRAELEELESQLADLEREIERRNGKDDEGENEDLDA